jgi:stringent starvation protein B
MASPSSLPNKKDVARALLLKGSVFVHLDPRGDGVVVPPWLKQHAQLVLQVGLDMPVPIPDLRVDDSGVLGTLSFKGAAFTCMVPWDAVFAVVGDDGRGMVWPGSMPPELAAEVERETQRTRSSSEAGAIEEVQKRTAKREPKRDDASDEAAPRARRPRRKRTSEEAEQKPVKAKRPSFEVIAGARTAESADDALRARDRGSRPSYLKLVK